MVHRHHQAFQNVLPLAGCFQLAFGAPGKDVLLVGNKIFQHLLQVQLLRLAFGNGGEIGASAFRIFFYFYVEIFIILCYDN